jgi:tartrate dehydrogenase/decarboxylase/D-malate dehydrogenase
VANPSGAIWAAALLLEHVGHTKAGRSVLGALEAAIAGGTRTRDLGGTATTDEMIKAVIKELLGPE